MRLTICQKPEKIHVKSEEETAATIGAQLVYCYCYFFSLFYVYHLFFSPPNQFHNQMFKSEVYVQALQETMCSGSNCPPGGAKGRFHFNQHQQPN